MGDFEVFNLLYLLIFLRAQNNKAGILWLLGCGVVFLGVFFRTKDSEQRIP